MGANDTGERAEMLRRAEMRWMSVEDSTITVPSREVALLGRALAAATDALVFYADGDNWTQLTSWGGRIWDDEGAAQKDAGKRAREVLAADSCNATYRSGQDG